MVSEWFKLCVSSLRTFQSILGGFLRFWARSKGIFEGFSTHQRQRRLVRQFQWYGSFFLSTFTPSAPSIFQAIFTFLGAFESVREGQRNLAERIARYGTFHFSLPILSTIPQSIHGRFLLPCASFRALSDEPKLPSFYLLFIDAERSSLIHPLLQLSTSHPSAPLSSSLPHSRSPPFRNQEGSPSSSSISTPESPSYALIHCHFDARGDHPHFDPESPSSSLISTSATIPSTTGRPSGPFLPSRPLVPRLARASFVVLPVLKVSSLQSNGGR